MTQTRDRLMTLLHPGENLYLDFIRAHGGMPFDPFGFESEPHPWLIEGALSGPVTIEVGSWLGHSARAMAGAMRLAERDAAVICVDTWLGDWELCFNEYRLAKMSFEYGAPHIYEKFLSNTIHAKLENYIVPLRLDSYNASRVLENFHIQADFIYVDGSHDEAIVALDLARYWGLLRVGGCMVVDDYDPTCENFFGLIRAVENFCKLRQVRPEYGARKVRLTK